MQHSKKIDREREVYDTLKARGFKEHQALAIIENFKIKSGIKGGAKGNLEDVFKTLNFNKGKQSDFEKFAGKPVSRSNIREQVDFMVSDLVKKEPKKWGQLKKTIDYQSASKLLNGDKMPNSDSVTEQLKKRIAQAESSGGKNTVNPLSNANGKYQIMPKTWANIEAKIGKLDKSNPADHEKAMNYLIDENKKALTKQGLPVDTATLYMMHFSGKTAFVKAALKNPNAPTNSIFSAAEMKANPWLPQTVGQAAQKLSKKVGINFVNPGTAERVNMAPSNVNKNYDVKERNAAWAMYRGDMAKAEKSLKGEELVNAQKSIQNKYAKKGWIGVDENGNPTGGFNDIVRDSNILMHKQTKEKARNAFYVANNLEDLLEMGKTNPAKTGPVIKYKNVNGRQIIDKTSVIDTKGMNSDQINAIQSVLGKNVKGPIPVVELLSKLEGQINNYVPAGQKVDLINHKTGARGKNLAFEGGNGGIGPTSGTSAAKRVYIPDLEKGNKGQKFMGYNITNTYDKRNFEYKDENNFGYKKMDAIYPDVAAIETIDGGAYKADDGDVTSTADNGSDASVPRTENTDSKPNDASPPSAAELQKQADAKAKKKDKWKTLLQGVSDREAPKQNGYDPKNFKKEIPAAELASAAALILSGKKMADTDLPMRDEMVSEGYMNYASELSRLSEIGLRPEEEAYAKRMLSESYSSGLEQLKNASNGNRNLVMGNLGRLDFQKQQGLLQLAVEDSRAKNEAFHKYGEAMKYISEFDASRDIANNERKYQNAMMTKQAGGAMMGGGMKSFLDTLKHNKENKPGSINHGYKSYMMQKMFDINPGLKDNGTGTVPGTISYRDRKQKELLEEWTKNKEVADQFLSLSAEKQEEVGKAFDMFGYNDKTKSLLDFTVKNKPEGKLDFTKMKDSVENMDWKSAYSGEENKETSILPETPKFGQDKFKVEPPSLDAFSTIFKKDKKPWEQPSAKEEAKQIVEKENPEDGIVALNNPFKSPDYFKDFASQLGSLFGRNNK